MRAVVPDTEHTGQQSGVSGSFVLFLLALVGLAILMPFLTLIVPGFASATSLRKNRMAMRWLWGMAIAVTGLFIAFWVFKFLGITFSQTGSVHNVGSGG